MAGLIGSVPNDLSVVRRDEIGRVDAVGLPSLGEIGDRRVEVERDYIAAALRASGGNRAKAAERLGIGAATLYRKLKQERR